MGHVILCNWLWHTACMTCPSYTKRQAHAFVHSLAYCSYARSQTLQPPLMVTPRLYISYISAHVRTYTLAYTKPQHSECVQLSD